MDGWMNWKWMDGWMDETAAAFIRFVGWLVVRCCVVLCTALHRPRECPVPPCHPLVKRPLGWFLVVGLTQRLRTSRQRSPVSRRFVRWLVVAPCALVPCALVPCALCLVPCAFAVSVRPSVFVAAFFLWRGCGGHAARLGLIGLDWLEWHWTNALPFFRIGQ